MTSKSIPLLVANLDHLTSYSVSGLWTHWNPEREPGSGSLVRFDKAVGRKRGSVRKERNSFLRGASQKHYCQATLNLFRNAFYLWLKDPQVFLKAEKCWSTANINSEGKVFTTGVVSGMNSQTRNFRNALGLISAGSSFLFLHPETSFM
jgi:hypothetical protein